MPTYTKSGEPLAGHVLKYGFNLTVGTALELIAPNGNACGFPASSGTVSIVSDDANDDLGGSGAEKVIVQGPVAGTYARGEEEIDLDGTSASVGTTELLAINRAYVSDGATNVGELTMTLGGVPYIIPAGYGQTQQLLYVVEDLGGAVVQVSLAKLWTDSSKTTTVRISERLPGADAWRVKLEVPLEGEVLAAEPLGPVFTTVPGAAIKVEAKVDAGTARVSGILEVISR